MRTRPATYVGGGLTAGITEEGAPMIGRILLTRALLAVVGFVLLVLIGLWDPYEQNTGALGYSGIYERYLASQAAFADDPKAYRAVVEAEHTRTASVGETAAIEE